MSQAEFARLLDCRVYYKPLIPQSLLLLPRGVHRSSNGETENPWYKTMNRIRLAVRL